jgi:hypothetical protein
MWKPVRGFEKHYEVNEDGVVRSVFRKKVRPTFLSDGIPTVALRVNGKRNRRYLHVVVAEAFLGPKPKGRWLVRLTGSKTSVSLDNLAYVPAYVAQRLGQATFRTRLMTPDDIRGVRDLVSKGWTYTQIAAHYKCSRGVVQRAATGRITQWSKTGDANVEHREFS